MEAILIVVAICAFVFFIYTLGKMSKKSTKTESKSKTDTKESKQREKKEDDIPDILKEVTTGNYMYDLAQSSNSEVEFVENENISMEENDSINCTNVAKAFDDIENIGDDLDDLIDVHIDEINEIEDDLNDDIGESYSESALLGDVDYDGNAKENNDVLEEYAKMSKKMKAILMSNALDKKHHD